MYVNDKVNDLCEIYDDIVQSVRGEIAKGIETVDTHELGEAIDMIKDLAEAKKDCWKACYYAKLIETMDDFEDEEDEYGRRGYHKRPLRKPHPYDYEDRLNREGGFEDMLREGDRHIEHPRYGQAYNDYQSAKRHYTTTNSQTDRDEMIRHANEHIADTMETVREIYKSSDPDLKKRIKTDLTKLIGEMPG